MKKLLKVSNSLIFLLFVFSFASLAQDEPVSSAPLDISAPGPAPSVAAAPTSSNQEKVIYEYKKEDYFDFEALSVKGELLTPGDLSGKAVKRVKFNSKEYIRKDFDDYIEDDLMEIY